MCMYMNMFVATHKYEKMLSVKQPQHIRLKAEHTYVKKVPLTCSFRRLTLLLSGEQQVECHLQEAAGVLNKTIVSLSYLKRQHVQTYKEAGNTGGYQPCSIIPHFVRSAFHITSVLLTVVFYCCVSCIYQLNCVQHFSWFFVSSVSLSQLFSRITNMQLNCCYRV